MSTASRPFHILGICGSLRRQSFNLRALKAAGELMPEGRQLSIASIRDIPMFDGEPQDTPASVKQLHAQMMAADGVLFASPEYNWTMSGALKNAIDWLSRCEPQPFAGKAVAILSATTGPLGGARSQNDLRKVMVAMEAYTFNRPEVFIGNAQGKFDAEGKLTDEATRKILTQQQAGFHKLLRTLRQGAA